MIIYFKTIVGSKLYGLDTPQSDTDYKGFGMPDLDKIIGLKRQETDVSKNLSENSEEALYSVNKYLHVLMKGNPTVFEIAFADDRFHQILTTTGEDILYFVRTNMVTKHLFKPYSAYFKAQQSDVVRLRTQGNRLDIIKQYGYDVKAASHTARIGYQCIELMETGDLNPTLQGKQREVCYDIKLGGYSLIQVNELINDIDLKMYEAYKKSILPEVPNYNKTNDFCIKIYKEYINKESK